MKLLRIFIFFLIAIFLQNEIHAQGRMNSDSLWKVFHTTTLPDSSRLMAIHQLAWQQVFRDVDSAITLSKMELTYAQKVGSKRFEANAFNTLGVANINKADFKTALVFHQKAFAIRQQMNDKKGMAASLNNIGIVYNYEGDVASSIDYYQRSLKLKLEIKDMAGVAASYSNLGQVFTDQQMDEEALNYFEQSLHIRDSLKDNRGLLDSYGKLASLYANGKDFSKAKNYTLKSISYCVLLHNQRELGNNYENLGIIFDKMDQHDSAYNYFNFALQLRIKANYKIGIGNCYCDIGSLKLEEGKLDDAIQFLVKSDKISVEEEDLELEQQVCKNLADAYRQKGDFKNAYVNLRRSDFIKDSLNTLEKSKTISKKILQYEFDQRASTDSLKVAKENEVKDLKRKEDVRQQQIYTVAGIVGFLLMVVLAFVLFRSSRQKQKNNEALEVKNKIITEQKSEVENQKIILEEKNKAILDSIHYAERIQKSLLPTEKFIDKNLKRLKKE